MFFIFYGCINQINSFEEKDIEYQVSIVMVGDNLIHKTIYQSVANDNYNFKPIYQEIKPYIKSFDLAFINQETILGGKEIGLSSYPTFNSPYELGDALVDTGFNLISLANNHTLDRGEKAVINSVNYWSKQSVVFSGSCLSIGESQVKFFEKNTIKFAFIAYTYGTNGIFHPNGKTYLANIYSDEKALLDLAELKKTVDIIIVSMHWGEEYSSLPNQEQKKQAYFLSSLGVDIIIGHHPHVIQPIDIISHNNHQTIVIYSLGNFLSDQVGINRLIGIATSLNITKEVKKTINNNLSYSLSIDKINAKLLFRYKDENNNFSIKWFDTLNNHLLMNFELYLEEKKQLIKTFHPYIKVE